MSFKVKYCHEIFDDPLVEMICKDIFYKTAEDIDADIQEIGFDRDHVHMTIDIGLNPIPKIAKYLKGRSGYFLLKAFPELKKKCFWGSGLWSPVVYFDSVGRSTDEEMNRYVRDQGMQTRLIEYH